MKQLLLSFLILFSAARLSARDPLINNPYKPLFDKAYAAHPSIPKGMLEAVAFCQTRFAHITHASAASESCTGIPNAYGVMGLTLDGQGYFSNNLLLVSQLSGVAPAQIISDPESNIMAYAAAFTAVRNMLNIGKTSVSACMPVLRFLSELPSQTEGQIYAITTQEYGYLDFLCNPDYQQAYGFPAPDTDLRTYFGSNYEVLSATSVIFTEEHISTPRGETFSTRSAAASADYPPALWNPAASCNYSSRAGTPISAVTIHDVEGSYAGCISWFQNCAANASAHYVLRSSDGQVTQMVLESNKAWHVGSENPYTIGLEHEGYASTGAWYTTAMYTGSADLVRDICSSGYGINPLRTYFGPGCSGSSSTCGIGSCTKIKGHQMFPYQTHTDPGPYWNWAKYYLLINNAPTISTLTATTGSIYDSGGPTGNYSNDERILTRIQPAGATSITLSFTSFNTEADWDYLFIYDGATTSAPLIGQYDGTAGPGTITSSGGSLLLEFRSDCATTAPGWAATWTSNATPSPTADSIAPTTAVTAVSAWETANFTANFTDADNAGGSGLEKSYYQVIDYNGSEWRANAQNGFFADNFDVAIHPDWTTATGTWNISGAALSQTDEALSNTNIHANLNQSLSNRYLYHFSGRISGAGTSRRAGFHFFCDNPALTNRGNSYFVWFRVDDALLQVYEVNADVFGSPVVNIPLTTVAGQWYDYKVIYDRITGKISVYRDNDLLTTWTDPTPLSTGNSISFRSGNAKFDINELKIYRSRPATAATVSVGPAATNDIRYQNPSPTIFSAKVKSICADSAGNLSSIYYQNINIDWTPPSVPDTIRDGTAADIAVTNSATQLSANWSSAADPNSAISKYYYSIGTTPGATDVYGWTDNWFSQSVTVTGLSLTDGQTYYFNVRSENGAGLQSSVASSNGQMVDLTTTGIDSPEGNSFAIYPNPASSASSLSMTILHAGKVNITMTDVLGREIILYNAAYEATGTRVLPLSGMLQQCAPGVYFVTMRTETNTVSQKVMIR